MGVIGKTLRFVVGLGLGAGIGAVVVLVVAPQSGKVSRQEIQQRVNDALSVGKRAQREREKELQDYWEQEVNVKYKDDEKKDEKK